MTACLVALAGIAIGGGADRQHPWARMLPDDGRVVSDLIVQALRGQARMLSGDGSQARALCSVHPLVESLPVVESLPERIPPRLERSGQPLPADGPTQRGPRADLASRELGWQPRVTPEPGLEPTSARFRQSLQPT